MESYIERFEKAAKEFSNAAAIVDRGGSRRTPYSELDDMRLRAASKIRALGVDPGSSVIINM